MARDPPLDPPSAADAADATARALDRDVRDVTPVEEGLNAVYRVTLADDTRVVLKAATLATDDEFLPEPYVLDRLDSETAVPVPAVRAVVRAADSPLDVAYYVADYCAGRAVSDVRALNADDHERLAAESGRHLARIHAAPSGGEFGPLRVGDADLAVANPRESWREYFREWTAMRVDLLRGDGVTADPDARFADLADDVARAFDQFPEESGVEPALLHGDYRPANLVLADPGIRPVVRAVLDVGANTGDGLLDLALAEGSLVDVPVGGTDRGDALRERLRAAYLAERPVESRSFDARYPYYRLYALAKAMGAFGYFAQFAREPDEDAVARRWRSRAESLVAALA